MSRASAETTSQQAYAAVCSDQPSNGDLGAESLEVGKHEAMEPAAYSPEPNNEDLDAESPEVGDDEPAADSQEPSDEEPVSLDTDQDSTLSLVLALADQMRCLMLLHVGMRIDDVLPGMEYNSLGCLADEVHVQPGCRCIRGWRQGRGFPRAIVRFFGDGRRCC
ncbi:hypothetical protein K432DRAFT_430598 [Lepidopterella palustris CBS 459.81]|uniref:Uncharacterized protein n=1 Tax=Lepidopterella palustris CBS 459.81 TaxID=1314670 RepID=A0A8E2J8K6_9PEZI|nr:hypothetical protein K432DRAFT_430598 [Lepidopterella palustris CBS 459.81]